MFQERKAEVIKKVQELTRKTKELYDVDLPKVDVRFDLRGRCAGWAGYKGTEYFMRFNQDMMVNSSWDHLINDTVPHELAHIICFFKGWDRGHGRMWKMVCRALGGTAERCHQETVTYAHGTVYYTSTTGHVIPVSKQRHTKIQRGATYTFRGGKGTITMFCSYSSKAPEVPQATMAARNRLPIDGFDNHRMAA
jgi:predicted SprT family Zn-dependent metalloprotease